MANTSAADWDETSPAAGDNVSYGDDEIRWLRAAVADRLEKEHVTPAASTVGGEHIPGGCQVLEYQTAASLAALSDRVEHGIGFSSDTKKLYRYDSSTNAQILDIDHGSLSGRTDDDHTIYAKLAGDTFTGAVVFQGAVSCGATVNMNSKKITGLPTPTANTEAATKSYVDSTGAVASCQVLEWQCPASGTGTETITLTGFSAVPKLAVFLIGIGTGTGNAHHGIGFTDGTNQGCIGTDGSARFIVDNSYVAYIANSLKIQFTSWTSAAITLTVSGYNASYYMQVMAFN
uniref:Uncharacterized protein n=1 Tax=viral metagenome TaxID=1070528 RepID=A0A6M3IIN0_9ZZZZ